MRIDASSAEIINSEAVYIHDDVLENLIFNRERKELCLLLPVIQAKENILFFTAA